VRRRVLRSQVDSVGWVGGTKLGGFWESSTALNCIEVHCTASKSIALTCKSCIFAGQGDRERYLDTVEVTGSIPVSRTRTFPSSEPLSVIIAGGGFCVGGRNLGGVDLALLCSHEMCSLVGAGFRGVAVTVV
jgi:hypothetical protein